jgi:hypothetical protein
MVTAIITTINSKGAIKIMEEGKLQRSVAAHTGEKKNDIDGLHACIWAGLMGYMSAYAGSGRLVSMN